MRILQIIDGLNPGGSQAVVMNLFRNIDREKFQFDFIISHEKQDFFRDEIERLGGKVYYIPKLNMINMLQYRRYWNDFYGEHPYDVVHSHVRSTASIDLSIAKKHGAFTVAHSHNTSNGKGILVPVKWLLQLPLRYIADCCAACSKESGTWLYGKGIIRSKKFVVIPNGIDCERYRFDEDKRGEVRERLNASGHFIIGHVGRLSYPKNHKFLIDVFSKLKKEENGMKLLLVGDGELRGELENQVKNLSLADSVIFTGSVSNTNDYMQAMDLLVFPSHYEGLPVTLVEAQCSGLKCLVSDVITEEVYLTNKIEALSTTGNSIEEWVGKIKEISDSASFADRIEGYELIRGTKFNVKKSVKELEKIYQNRTSY